MIFKIKSSVKQLKTNMAKKVLTISVWIISVVSAILVIANIIIIMLAKFSEQLPIESHGSVRENEIIQLKYRIRECPRVSYFYSSPAEHTLYLRVFPDFRSSAGVTLSFFSNSIDNTTYYGRIASCFAKPNSHCSIEIPRNEIFYAVVSADSNMDETVDTILFRWECVYTRNVPLIAGTVFLVVNLLILLIIVFCLCFKVRILKILTKLVRILNVSLNKSKVNTPIQMTFDEMLYTETIY